MSKLRCAVVGMLLVCVAGALNGCGEKSLAISKASSPACAAGGDCAVYMTITNPGQADALVGARADVAAAVELHKLTIDEQGGMKMQPIEKIALPAAGAVELKPGSQHLMLVGLKRELRMGDTFPLTVLYEKGGEASVEIVVLPEN